MLEAAAALPDEQLRGLSAQVVDWLQAPHVEYFADEAAALVARLLAVGDVSAALSAVAALLAVRPDPRLAEKAAAGDSPMRPTPEASARMSGWDYERLINRLIDPIVDTGGIEAFRLLASLLDDALRMSRWAEEASDDFSYIWRPAIEDHVQNSDDSIKNVLVSAVRDAALRLGARGEDELVAVFEELDARSLLHRRIALHLLASARDAVTLVSRVVGDRRLFDEYRVKHEYSFLLRRRFQDADEQTRARVLAWIDAGPDLDDYRRRSTEFDGSPPTDEQVRRYAKLWQRDWLTFLVENLQGDHADQYQHLVAEFGEPEHPDFLSWSTIWTGPESPVGHTELVEWPVEDVIGYLRSWKADDESPWRFGPSIEGLGRAFAEVVKERARDYAPYANNLRDLDPTYVRSFFSGLESSLRDGGAFDWENPIALAEFVVSQPFEADEGVPDRDRDPGWRWCRRQIGAVLRSGFSDRGTRIPFLLRPSAWRVVERLTNDPNPSPEHEQRYGGANMDPLTLSINTNRGTAMHAVVEYALWIRRYLEEAEEDTSVGFEAMPEVRTVLEAHLDPETDPSLAVRAVYGRWLPWLLLLDEPWVLAQLGAMLPGAPGLSAVRDAVWSTYISWCAPYDSALRALRSEYEQAISRVPSGTSAGTFRHESADAKLGEHLVTFFWRGLVDASVLEEFFNRAGDALSSNVMEFVGRALRNTRDEISEAVGARIQDLWEQRLGVADEDAGRHQLEVRAFGTTFASGKLEDRWSLTMLERAVSLAGAPRFGHLVAERLVHVAESEPAAASRILAAMLANPEKDWDYVGWRDEALAIVTQAVQSGDPSAVEGCEAIIDSYVRRGHLEFRGLAGRRQADDHDS